MKKTHAFTLVELLVVIAIISVLAAMLLPTLEQAFFEVRVTSCINRHKQFYLATLQYANDNRNYMPEYGGNLGGGCGDYIADAYRKSVCSGRLLATGYATPELYLEPDHINNAPTGDSRTFSYNGSIRWSWLKPNPPSIYLPMNSTFGFLSMFLLDNPWGMTVGRRWDRVPQKIITPIAMCRIDAQIGVRVQCHKRLVSNCTYVDGHVRSLLNIEERSSLYPTYDSRNQNFNVAGWWMWAAAEDRK